MKTYIFGLLAVLLITLPVRAQDASKARFHMERTLLNYNHSLLHEVDDIAESAIYHVIRLRQDFQDADYRPLVASLEKLALEGRTPRIRYKAQLAMLFFNFPELFADIRFEKTENPNAFFQRMAQKLETSVLTQR